MFINVCVFSVVLFFFFKKKIRDNAQAMWKVFAFPGYCCWCLRGSELYKLTELMSGQNAIKMLQILLGKKRIIQI